MNGPVWIEVHAARVIHQMQLAEHGGVTGIRDRILLESALAKPRELSASSPSSVTLFQIAAAYAFGFVKNHVFVHGNNPTAFIVCLSFLRQNGFVLVASLPTRYLTFEAVAAGNLTEAEFAEWLQEHSQPV